MERTRRRLWTRLITVAASLVLVAAVASALFQFVVLAVPGYREDLAQHVSQLAGRPVRIEAVALTWRGYYPSLDLSNVQLLDTNGDRTLMALQRVRLGFSIPDLLRGDFQPSRLDLEGFELQLRREASGRWRLEGLEPRNTQADLDAVLARFEALDGLHLARCSVTIVDERRELDARYFLVDGGTQRRLLGRAFHAEIELPASIGRQLELEAFLSGSLVEPATLSGRLHLELAGLNGEALVSRWLLPGTEWHVADGRLDARATLEGGTLQQARVTLQTGAVQARRGTHRAGFNRLSAAADVTPVEGQGWRVVLDRFLLETQAGRWPETGAAFEWHQPADGAESMELSLSHARLVDVAPWLGLVRADPWLTDLHDVSGTLRDLQLRWEPGQSENYSLRGRFYRLHLPSAGRALGFAGLAGDLAADEDGGRVVLHPAPLQLDLPGILVHPVPFERITAEAEWRRQPCPGKCPKSGAWRMHVPHFSWSLMGGEGEGEADLEMPADGAPRIQMTAQFGAPDATRFKPFIPRFWSERLRNWLEDAVQAASVTNGRLQVEGALSDFPFNEGPGRFELDMDIAGARLQFAPEWPALDKLQARLEFRANVLSIAAKEAVLENLKVEQATAHMAGFSEKRLRIDARAQGALDDFYQTVRNSPLRERLAALTENTDPGGEATVDLALEIPLDDLSEVQAAGTVHVEQASIRYAGLREPVRDIAGRIGFENDGLVAEGLKARWHELPLTARIEQLPGAGSLLTVDFDWTVNRRGQGASQLIPVWLLNALEGTSHWRAMMNFGADPDGGLRLESDLAGLQVALPAPLGKPAEEVQNLSVHVSPGDRLPLRLAVDYGSRLNADLQFARAGDVLQLRRGVLQVGSGPAPEPGNGGLVLGARIRELDLAAWSEVISVLGRAGAAKLVRAEVEAERWRAGPYTCTGAKAILTPRSGGWRGLLSGPCAEGELVWQGGLSPALDARLTHLVLESTADLPEPGERPALEPSRLPTLGLDIQRLRLGAADLGHAVVSSARVKNGQRLQALKLEGGIARLDASGVWTRTGGASSAELRLQLNSSNLGALMKALGYAASLDAEAAKIEARLRWKPDPKGVRWPYAGGEVDLEFENGQLYAVEPGAGRMLGLINFYALPRRLSLNFRDVVAKGLGFDRIEGRFELGEGHARTERVEITGPSLKMVSKGRIGLADRDYDQHITVYPGLSAGVTLGAVLLGGPAAGALALVAQEVLNKPLDQVTQLSYRLTGSWDNPKLEPVRADAS